MVDNFDMSGQLPEWVIARGKKPNDLSDLGLQMEPFPGDAAQLAHRFIGRELHPAFTVGFDSLV